MGAKPQQVGGIPKIRDDESMAKRWLAAYMKILPMEISTYKIQRK
jgi:hypothetical protein